MEWRRWLATAGMVALMVAVAGPALAQGRGNGKPKPDPDPEPGPAACSDDLVATLAFARHPDLSSPPALFATNEQLPLTIAFRSGGFKGNATLDSDGTLPPLTLDFGQVVFNEDLGDIYDAMHPGGPTMIEFDPRVVSGVSHATQSMEYGMYDMIPGATYPMKMSLWFYVTDGLPDLNYEDKATKTTVEWVLRFKDNAKAPETATWLDAKRDEFETNKWVLTTRTKSNSEDGPLHQASLWHGGSKGKDGQKTQYSGPSIPFELTITVACGEDGCPLPGDC